MVLREREIGSVVEPEDAFSTTEIEKTRFSFTWDIVNFPALGDDIYSPVFKAGSKGQGQHEWKLKILPHSKKAFRLLLEEAEDKKEEEEYIGLFLYLQNPAYDVEVKVELRCSLMDSSRKILHTKKSPTLQTFTSDSAGRGWTPWILRSKVMDPANASLCHGHILRVHCDIFTCGGIQHSSVSSRPVVLRKFGEKAQPKSDPDSNLNLMFDSLTLQEKMMSFLAGGKFSDVTLKTENESFPFSKLILAAHSPVFEAMFDSGMLESTENVVQIKDFSPDAVRGMIQFICSGKTQLLEESAGELLSIADKYQISGLREKCEETLLKNLSVENAADTLMLAHFHSPRILQPQVIYFINRFKKQVVNTEGYKEMVKAYPIICSELYASLE